MATLAIVARMKPRFTSAYLALMLSFVPLLARIALGNVVVNSDLDAVVTALHLANATALFGVMMISGVLMVSEGSWRATGGEQ